MKTNLLLKLGRISFALAFPLLTLLPGCGNGVRQAEAIGFNNILLTEATRLHDAFRQTQRDVQASDGTALERDQRGLRQLAETAQQLTLEAVVPEEGDSLHAAALHLYEWYVQIADSALPPLIHLADSVLDAPQLADSLRQQMQQRFKHLSTELSELEREFNRAQHPLAYRHRARLDSLDVR